MHALRKATCHQQVTVTVCYTAALSADWSARSWLHEFVLDTSLFAALYGDSLVPGRFDHSYVQLTFLGGSIKAFLLLSFGSIVAFFSI